MEELRPYILLISKPFGTTSFRFTEKVRTVLGARKAGHTGTLDPIATGLMVIALNSATRFIPFITPDIKEYVVQIPFGVETDTDDITGNVINSGGKIPNVSEIEAVLSDFMGNVRQRPPFYSAKKVNGKRLYKYARDKNEVEVRESEVYIYEIKIIFFEKDKLVLRVLCSKGTYMRALARDLGRRLGTFATLSAIARTRVGDFYIKDAAFLSCITRGARKGFIPLNDAVDLPTLTIENKNTFLNGIDIKTEFVKVQDKAGNFIGIGEVRGSAIHPKKVQRY